VMLASIASEAAMGVGSAVCCEGWAQTKCEEGEEEEGVSAFEQWVSSLAPARGGREGSRWGRASRKQRGDVGRHIRFF
jgi:hypothetical protein